jgi:hypothetical protein
VGFIQGGFIFRWKKYSYERAILGRFANSFAVLIASFRNAFSKKEDYFACTTQSFQNTRCVFVNDYFNYHTTRVHFLNRILALSTGKNHRLKVGYLSSIFSEHKQV